MSNQLAVATVTAALQQLIMIALQSSSEFLTNSTVTIGQPVAASDPSLTVPTVNLCLYQISPNVGYVNNDLPSLSSDGATLLQQPVTAIDLHYLVTFYGAKDSDKQLDPELLLGIIINALHSYPFITEELITAAQIAYAPLLNATDLASSIERVKFTPITEVELNTIWGKFFQTIPYSLSLAYKASVILINSTQAVTPALPVQPGNVNINVNLGNFVPANTVVLVDVSNIQTVRSDTSYSLQQISSTRNTINIVPPADAIYISQYNVYLGNNNNPKLYFIGSIQQGQTSLPINTSVPISAGATGIYVFSANNIDGDIVEMTSAVSTNIPPSDPATEPLTLDLTTANGTIYGTVTINRAADETYLTDYRVYFGDVNGNKLSVPDNFPLAILSKFLNNGVGQITWTIPSSAPIKKPSNAASILVFANNQASEMYYGISQTI